MIDLGKFLLLVGVIFILTGLLVTLMGHLTSGLWRLPGDIIIKRDGLSFYLPLGTSIFLSVVLSILLTLLFSFLKR